MGSVVKTGHFYYIFSLEPVLLRRVAPSDPPYIDRPTKTTRTAVAAPPTRPLPFPPRRCCSLRGWIAPACSSSGYWGATKLVPSRCFRAWPLRQDESFRTRRDASRQANVITHSRRPSGILNSANYCSGALGLYITFSACLVLVYFACSFLFSLLFVFSSMAVIRLLRINSRCINSTVVSCTHIFACDVRVFLPGVFLFRHSFARDIIPFRPFFVLACGL